MNIGAESGMNDVDELLAAAVAHRNLDACVQLATHCLDRGEPLAAVKVLRSAIAMRPNFADTWNLLGIAFRRSDDLQAAVSAYRKAVELDPSFAEAWNNLGVTLQQKGLLTEAIEAYSQAVQQQPDLADPHHNLAAVLRAVGDLEMAYRYAKRSLELRPQFVPAMVTMGRIYLATQNLQHAVSILQEATRQAPQLPEAHYFLATALENLGAVADAADSFRRTVTLAPSYMAALDGYVHQLQHLCEWSNLEERSEQLMRCVDSQSEAQISPDHSDLVSPFSFLCLPTEPNAAQQAKCARRWATGRFAVEPMHPPFASRRVLTGPRPNRKIRVGYLSSDFHSHATAWLIAEWMESHNPDRFEVIGYSYGPDDGSSIRRRILQAFDGVTDVRNYTHEAAAHKIREDAIDILVDLKGYTQFARPEILAYRPAPIQINYLGYPGTMGTDFIDFILADDFTIPPEDESFYSERVLRVQGCYQVNDRFIPVDDTVAKRTDYGLPENAFVFCCFNSHYKFTPRVFDVWMQLLKKTPHAVLWLLSGHKSAEGNLRRQAQISGVDPNRLVFAPREPHAKHLSRLRLADLCVDTFPVTAHTTASDALRTGLPLVSMRGHSMVSRVAGSLLNSLNLQELIAVDLADYEAIIMRLVRDPSRLLATRRNWRLRLSTAKLSPEKRLPIGSRRYTSLFSTRCFQPENRSNPNYP